MQELKDFINKWEDCPIKKVFIELTDLLNSKDKINLTFNPRPGITYSLRAKHYNQTKRDLFVMIDVIDDDPSNRWLSICFYGDMITDPEQRGNLIPNGLQGEDGYCFDFEEWDRDYINYIKKRIEEAYQNASK